MPTIQQIIQALKLDLKITHKGPPSLLAHNISWFTNCDWVTQMTAFKRISRYF